MIAVAHSFERQCVAAVGRDRERGGLPGEGGKAGKRPGADHVAVDQRLNGLVAVIIVLSAKVT